MGLVQIPDLPWLTFDFFFRFFSIFFQFFLIFSIFSSNSQKSIFIQTCHTKSFEKMQKQEIEMKHRKMTGTKAIASMLGNSSSKQILFKRFFRIDSFKDKKLIAQCQFCKRLIKGIGFNPSKFTWHLKVCKCWMYFGKTFCEKKKRRKERNIENLLNSLQIWKFLLFQKHKGLFKAYRGEVEQAEYSEKVTRAKSNYSADSSGEGDLDRLSELDPSDDEQRTLNDEKCKMDILLKIYFKTTSEDQNELIAVCRFCTVRNVLKTNHRNTATFVRHLKVCFEYKICAFCW